jgi:hypothetical protein
MSKQFVDIEGVQARVVKKPWIVVEQEGPDLRVYLVGPIDAPVGNFAGIIGHVIDQVAKKFNVTPNFVAGLVVATIGSEETPDQTH